MSEKAVAPHSSTLAWKTPWTAEPGRLRRPGGREESDTTERLHFDALEKEMATHSSEAQGRGSLVGCRLCGHMESDTTEVT